MPQANGTANATVSAIPEGKTIGEAAAAITAARNKEPPAEPEPEPQAAAPAPNGEGEPPEPASEPGDGTEQAGGGGGEPEPGESGAPPPAAALESSLKTLPPEELARELVLPLGENGALVKVPLGEAIKAGLRQADYSRKTMELATERKALSGERAQYAAVLPILMEQLKANAPRERTPQEWQQLWDTNPIEAAREAHAYEQYQRQLAAGTQEQQRVRAEQEREFLDQLETNAKAEADKLKARLASELDTPEKAAKFRADISSYLREYEFSDNDLALVTDHRYFIIAHKARLYDQMQKARGTVPNKIATPPQRPPVKPGQPPAPNASQNRRAAEASAKLKKTGSISAAAEAIKALRGKR